MTAQIRNTMEKKNHPPTKIFEATYIASTLGTATTAHHGGLDCAAPPVTPGAGAVADQREVGLLQLRRQGAASYERWDCKCEFEANIWN